MFKNLTKDDFYEHITKYDSKGIVHYNYLILILAIINVAISTPFTLLYKEMDTKISIWPYVLVVYKIIWVMSFLVAIIMLVPKVKFKYPHMVIKAYNFMGYLVMATTLITSAIIIEEQYRLLGYILYGFAVLFHPLVWHYYFISCKQIRNGALRQGGPGIDLTVLWGPLIQLIIKAKIPLFIVSSVATILGYGIYVVGFGLILLIPFYRIFFTRLMIDAHVVKHYDDVLSEKEIEAMVSNVSKNNDLIREKYNEKKYRHAPSKIMFLIKPLQVILLLSMGFWTYGLGTLFKEIPLGYMLSLVLVFFLMKAIIRWMMRYDVGRGGIRIINGSIGMVLLVLPLPILFDPNMAYTFSDPELVIMTIYLVLVGIFTVLVNPGYRINDYYINYYKSKRYIVKKKRVR